MSETSYLARDRYRDPAEAASYEARRFRSFKGRLVDRRERALVTRALAAARILALGDGRIERLLDLPAGTGRLAPLLGAWAPLVLAADRSREMLRQGARYGEARYEGKAVQADATRLPFRDSAFDAVVCLRLLGHLPPAVRRLALAEMRRVSRSFLIVAFYDSTPVTRLRRRLGPRLRRGAWFAEPLTRSRHELETLGLRVRLAMPLLRWLSETWVLLLERVDDGPRAPGPGNAR